jgi:signal transduction histidine kinase
MTISVERKPVDLAAVVARAMRLFAIQAKERGISLESSGGAVPAVPGDETKLTWALSNLIANAIRYTPKGGVVRVAAEERDGAVHLSVADTGPGIPAELQERIFDRYAQSTSGGDPGAAGLGLAIVRDVVQAHGGRIRLDSTPGRGTRFTLELPIR